MKNSADLGGCYRPRPLASSCNTLLGLQNSSYPTQPHSIIAKLSYDHYPPHAISWKTIKIKVPYEGPTHRSDRRELNSYENHDGNSNGNGY